MTTIDSRLIRITTRLAGAVAGVVALSLPLGFFILALQSNLAAMHEEAKYGATDISRLINANPAFWQFEEPRLLELIKDQTETDLPESRRIVDSAGRVVVQSFESTEATESTETKEFRESLNPLNALVITRSANLMDSGTVVGRYEVIRNLRPLLFETAIVSLLGLWLGALVLVVIRVYPLRALKHTLQTLASEKERAEITLEAIGDAVVTIDDQGTVLSFNSAATKMFGHAAHEIVGRDVKTLMAASYHQALADYMERDPRTDKGYRIGAEQEVVGQRRDGETFPVALRVSEFFLEGRRRLIASMRDITERNRAEQKLVSANRALQMLSRSGIAINRIDDEARLLAEVCRLAVEVGGYRMAWVGYAHDDENKTIKPVAHAGQELGYLAEIKLCWRDDQPSGQGPAGQAIRTGVPQQTDDIGHPNNNFHWRDAARQRAYFSVLALPLRNHDHSFGVLCLYAGAVQHFTAEEIQLLQELADNLAFGIVSLRARLKQQRSEEAERKTAMRLHEQASLIDLAPGAIVVCNLDLTIRFWSKGAERLYGWPAEQMLGKTMQSLMYRDPQLLTGAIEQIKAAGGDWTGEVEQVASDGSPVFVEMRGTVVRNQHAQVNGVLIVITDVRERRQARQDILLLNSSLEERVQKRTAQLEFANQQLEAFSYSVSHDLRGPLSSINGFSALLEKSITSQGTAPLTERSRHYLARIRAGVGQMDELIDAMLTLAQVSRSSLVWESVDLSAVAGVLLLGFQEQEPSRVVRLCVEPGLVAQGDPRLLGQVLYNLLANAWKFSGCKDCTCITMGKLEADDGRPVYFVRDNGAGFDMAHALKLFDAFQRLHTEAEFAGTGIGLATVQRIIARHSGRVWAESVQGDGTTFYFTLGAAAA